MMRSDFDLFQIYFNFQVSWLGHVYLTREFHVSSVESSNFANFMRKLDIIFTEFERTFKKKS